MKYHLSYALFFSLGLCSLVFRVCAAPTLATPKLALYWSDVGEVEITPANDAQILPFFDGHSNDEPELNFVLNGNPIHRPRSQGVIKHLVFCDSLVPPVLELSHRESSFTLGEYLPSPQGCTIQEIIFRPTTEGRKETELTVFHGSVATTIPLSGTGVAVGSTASRLTTMGTLVGIDQFSFSSAARQLYFNTLSSANIGFRIDLVQPAINYHNLHFFHTNSTLPQPCSLQDEVLILKDDHYTRSLMQPWAEFIGWLNVTDSSHLPLPPMVRATEGRDRHCGTDPFTAYLAPDNRTRLVYTQCDREVPADHIQGRVEIRRTIDSDWGTVCDDAFVNQDTRVVCGAFGLDATRWLRSNPNDFNDLFPPCGEGPEDRRILLDNMHCKGNEQHLTDCEQYGIAHNNPDEANLNCIHTEDIGVECQPRQLMTACTMTPTTETLIKSSGLHLFYFLKHSGDGSFVGQDIPFQLWPDSFSIDPTHGIWAVGIKKNITPDGRNYHQELVLQLYDITSKELLLEADIEPFGISPIPPQIRIMENRVYVLTSSGSQSTMNIYNIDLAEDRSALKTHHEISVANLAYVRSFEVLDRDTFLVQELNGSLTHYRLPISSEETPHAESVWEDTPDATTTHSHHPNAAIDPKSVLGVMLVSLALSLFSF